MKVMERLGLVLVAGFLVMTLSAGAQNPDWLSSLQQVPSNALPVFGNYYLAQNYGSVSSTNFLVGFGPPLPGILPAQAGLPVYRVGNTPNFIIDDLDVDYSALHSAGRMMTIDAAFPSFPGGGDGDGGDGGSSFPSMDFSSSTNLWIAITNVAGATAFLTLNNATNQVYEIITKADLFQANWTIEQEVWPTNQTSMPFTLSQAGRSNLFVWAMDWTGVTHGGNTVPDWWFWENFGTTALWTPVWIAKASIPWHLTIRTGWIRTPSVLTFNLTA